MGITRKVVGFVAALGLTMSMVAGVAAQTSVEGNLELDPGSCQLTVTSGTFDLGTATWDGTNWSYNYQTGAQINVDVEPGWTAPGQSRTCAVTVDTTGLSNGTHTFSKQYFKSGNAPMTGDFGQIFPAVSLPATHNIKEGESRITMSIQHALPRSFTPGDYTGTFTLTLDDGQ